ncbi:DHA2 family efflux MFS transporter permease subunit [Clostridium sp. 19966]|uniref:DHA2 family efflux MFS transporter permease subunit n=1 Tax=Clostridium sp. 19966 TaxID=2768166 RepID=UPI0028DEBEDE|nr:DHA2 family efflux MFS transporter permease subunit [Clostridium sp. 19966]MDT8718181.1 DHA2 family efflux MFS transporter permease subunit [Clostridium sp. 19966]
MSSNTKEVEFWPVISSLFLGTFLTALGISTINLALTDLMKNFNTDLDSVKWTVTAFMLATGTIAPITGYLGEKFSYKKLYLVSLIGFTIASLLCVFSWNIQSLIAFRILQGAFNGLATPATMSIIFQVIPRKKQPLAISFWSLCAMLAPALGPTISGWLIETFNWKAIFLVNIPIGILAILMVVKSTPYYKLNPPKGFDMPGFITSLVASLMLLTAFSEGDAYGWLSSKIVLLIVGGIIILSIFIKIELTSSRPALNLKIFKFKGYSRSVIVRAVINMSLYAGTLLTPLFLQNAKHISALETGLIMLPPSLIMALFMLVVGKLYNIMDPRILVIAGIIFMALGSFKMSYLTIDTSNAYIITWMIVRNIGIAIGSMPVTNIGMSSLNRKLSGNGSAVNNWVSQGVGSLAIGIFTSLLTMRTTQHIKELSNLNITPSLIANKAFVMGVNDVYFISFIIILIALPLSLLLKKEEPEEESLEKIA